VNREFLQGIAFIITEVAEHGVNSQLQNNKNVNEGVLREVQLLPNGRRCSVLPSKVSTLRLVKCISWVPRCQLFG